MKRILAIPLLAVLLVAGCTPLEVSAYRTIVASKAFLDSIRMSHPECTPNSLNVLCIDLRKATAAKDTLIDVAEVYCASPTFAAGGPCTPPTDATLKAQASAKLQAALLTYKQFETDLRGVAK